MPYNSEVFAPTFLISSYTFCCSSVRVFFLDDFFVFKTIAREMGQHDRRTNRRRSVPEDETERQR